MSGSKKPGEDAANDDGNEQSHDGPILDVWSSPMGVIKLAAPCCTRWRRQ